MTDIYNEKQKKKVHRSKKILDIHIILDIHMINIL